MSPSSRFAVRHYSNAALVFLFPPSHSSMQGVERLFQETHVPLCRIGGKCAGFRAKTVEVSGHLPSVKQTVEDYIAAQHARSTLSLDTMTVEQAAQFDMEMQALLLPFSQDGLLTFSVVGGITWGTPKSGAK